MFHNPQEKYYEHTIRIGSWELKGGGFCNSCDGRFILNYYHVIGSRGFSASSFAPDRVLFLFRFLIFPLSPCVIYLSRRLLGTFLPKNSEENHSGLRLFLDPVMSDASALLSSFKTTKINIFLAVPQIGVTSTPQHPSTIGRERPVVQL